MRKQWVLGLVLALSATPVLAVTFNTMDTNHDGNIKKKEFYDGIFSVYDHDKNGNWDKTEFRDAQKAGLLR